MTRSIAVLSGCLALAGGVGTAAGQAAPGKPSGDKEQKPAATTITLPPSPQALLPDAFDGWVTAGPIQSLSDPAQADAANAAALKEYGFTFGALAHYQREGDTLTVRALRFADASGSYGAYSFYRPNGWAKEQIGAGAASNKGHVLFWRGDTVVDATFSRVGPMSAGELREIAGQLPEPGGDKSLTPPILAFLPQGSLDGQTTHYAMGPAGYTGGAGVLPAGVVGFDRDAESATASYSLPSGPATLTIIEYPTPQIAEAQEAAIRAYIKAGSQAQPPWPKPLQDSDVASLEVRRSDVLVALVSGDAVPEESHRLLEMVHYEAELTSIPQPTESDVSKTSRLLMGIAGIVIVGSLAAILLGFFLGGGRALYRIAHGKPASSVYDEEFIHLDLREEWKETTAAVPRPHPKG
ncbi:MAG: DUF6599 family protein [Terracidiphilus sp.]